MALARVTKYFDKKSLEDYFEYIKHFHRKENTQTHTILATIGAAVLAHQSFKLFGFLYRHFIRREYNLLQRYGSQSWVVVTGASDGIGKAFAIEFASRGFNVVIIARNQAKSEKVIDELKKSNPTIQVKLIVADFANSYENEFYENIYHELKDLDISILVNNVGDSQRGLYSTKTPKSLWDLTLVNTLPQSILTNMLIEKLTQRKTRSAIINLSSIVSNYNFIYNCLYAASKRFDDIQSQALLAEYGNKLDILCLKPGWVLTQLAVGIRESFNATTPQKFVRHSLRQLVHENVAWGHWKHEIAAFQFDHLLRYKRISREQVGKRGDACDKWYNDRKADENKTEWTAESH